MTRDRSPLRYVPWLALDIVKVQLALFATVAVGLPLVILRLQKSMGTAPEAAVVQSGTFTAVLTIAVLMAIGGAIGGDLKGGYYRAWFSKPISPWWYYLQRWLLGGIAVLLAPLMLGGVLALVLHRGSGITGDLMLTVALGYLLVGSACLLFSNFTARDWLVVFLLSFMQQRLAQVVEASGNFGVTLPTWLVWLEKTLPPFHLINAMKPALHGNELLHVLGYGVAMLAAALVIVQVRPLGSGGRA
ncbi:MAG: hypothetical protein ABJC19_03930 [Gemmatimonadota bacterium]